MISLSIDYNKDTAYLLEALKVESYYNSKNFTLTLQNKDIGFLDKIENILYRYSIKPKRRLLIKIRLPNKTDKKEVILNKGNKKLSFHVEKSPFDQNKVKAVTNIPYQDKCTLKIYYKGKEFKIKIDGEKNNIKSGLDCWVYRDLRFPLKSLFEFLEKFGGNKNDFTKILLHSNPQIIASAFSALFDCEGTINWYGLKRVIRIRMRNKKYLEEWSELLKKHRIGNKFRKNKNDWEINVSGWEDFNRLEKMGFKLHHSKKTEKWEKMILGFKRNQISRNSYKIFYIDKLKEINKKITAKELADSLSKSKRVINHYLLKLEKEKLIQCDRKNWPYLYFISTSSVR